MHSAFTLKICLSTAGSVEYSNEYEDHVETETDQFLPKVTV